MSERNTKKQSSLGRLWGSKAAEPSEPTETEASSAPKTRWFDRLKQGLGKTSSRLSDGIAGLFTKRKLEAATLPIFPCPGTTMNSFVRLEADEVSGRRFQDVVRSPDAE